MTNQALYCNSPLVVDVQMALEESELAESEEPPSFEQLSHWANSVYRAAVTGGQADAELTIRLVDVKEITKLNRDYRHQDKATNVLSFPFEAIHESTASYELKASHELKAPYQLKAPQPGLDIALLGDVIICHQVIVREAHEQQKTVSNHYAHMVVHGVLHLLGYDHQAENDAQKMEALELEILAQFNISDPYQN